MIGTAALAVALAPSLAPFDLRCEALVSPLDIGTTMPRLSWKLQAARGRKNLSQSGFRILAARDPRLLAEGKADLWDSGMVSSDQTYSVEYKGVPVGSNEVCWWKVQVRDQDGVASAWSKATSFSVGLLSEADWKAEWIGYDAPARIRKQPDPFDGAKWLWPEGKPKQAQFKTSIQVSGEITKATLRISVDDHYRVLIGGKEVHRDSEATDSWRVPAIVDLKPHLILGANDLQISAVDTGGDAGALAVITLQYANGQTQRIVTDGTWQESLAGDTWQPAHVVTEYGAAPWGQIGPKQLALPPPRFLRKGFELSKAVKRATITGSAFGLFELYLNGQRVGKDYFMPGWSAYEKRVYSKSYDVTALLQKGKNMVGAILGDGWYAGYVGYGGRREHYGKNLRARVQLNLEYSDGSRDTIGTSSEWQASTGPIQFSDFLMGETYDAQRESPNWCTTEGSDFGWRNVDTGTEMNPPVEPYPGQPVRVYQELRARSVTQTSPDVYVLDLGQNLAGFARLKVKGQAGQKITLRYAERLNPDGTIYVTNLRGAKATDTYICHGEGEEVWSPRFTFHGFQYIEVSGLGHRPKSDEVVGLALSSDCPTVGRIETSDPMINRLVSNAWWTQKMNFIDIPTDCPQRDERLGWTGDAQAYIRTATMLCDVQPFFTKWLVSLDDSQRADGQYPMVAPLRVAGGDGGPAWADAGVICPWTIYDVYGDQALLARHYPQMKKFVEFCRARSTPDLLPPKEFHCFGDWVSINAPTPNEVIYEAYFAGSARLLGKAAAALGNQDEATQYAKLYQDVKTAFQKAYVGADGVVKGDSQCAYVLALAFDLVDGEMAKIAGDRLVADIEKRGWHLSTGFVGTRDIMHVLSKIGRNDVAFRLLHNTTFPSWGFTIKNGATSIWERWDGWTPEKGFQDPGMNSFAHYAFGAVVGWVMAQPGGITNLDPGFKTIKIDPQLDPNLKWMRAQYDSVRGPIVCHWGLDGKRILLRVVVPPNATAEVHVPHGEVVKVGSGEYRFESKLPE